LEEVADITFPDKKHTNSKISLSRFTVRRIIEELANSIKESLQINTTDCDLIIFHCFIYQKNLCEVLNDGFL
jgi:hypothetical protein